jgi:hypothetical protein
VERKGRQEGRKTGRQEDRKGGREGSQDEGIPALVKAFFGIIEDGVQGLHKRSDSFSIPTSCELGHGVALEVANGGYVVAHDSFRTVVDRFERCQAERVREMNVMGGGCTQDVMGVHSPPTSPLRAVSNTAFSRWSLML